MGDSKFFASTTKRGELLEIKADLSDLDKVKIKDALKKIIASMTVGKDVSALFPDVVKNMQTEDIELKKLVYLYLMNYAKTQPELVILAVNTFIKDCDDNNPLVRSLALRTMGCLRVDKILDYVCQPLSKCLKDQDPYVRKTAVIGIAKLFDLSPSLCETNGFFEELANCLSDPNPMVVSNAVAAMSEIMEDNRGAFLSNPGVMNKLLTALNECNEWGQIAILDALATYNPRDGREAESICERVTPRLTHVNASVVLSAVRVLLKYMELVNNGEFIALLYKKMGPPLVTLLTCEPEVQYVALRNLQLIIRKYPEIFQQDLKVFFCKYNDPPYVKVEKLDIMTRLVNERNIEQLLSELKEYAAEADVDFVRKSVRAIGQCAIKLEGVADRCIAVIFDLIKTKVNYIVQESVIVIKDIFRKYPNQYESLIPTLCESLEELDESEAKASMIWIIGEYGDRIENSGELLQNLMENFEEEPAQVQMQLLTAVVKVFLKNPQSAQNIVQTILQLATTKTDSPDLRDRGYIYWRLLSTDPNAAKAIVLAEKPPVSASSSDNITGGLLQDLILNIGTMASVYHKPSSTFTSSGKIAPMTVNSTPKTMTEIEQGGFSTEYSEEREEQDASGTLNFGSSSSAAAAGGDNLLDLDLGPSPSTAQSRTINNVLDLLDDFSIGGSSKVSAVQPMQELLSAQAGKGLQVHGTFSRKSGIINLELRLTNMTGAPMSDFAIQINKNSFGIVPASQLQVASPLFPSQTIEVAVPLTNSGAKMRMDPLNSLQVALKNNSNVSIFTTQIPLNVLLSEDGSVPQQSYMGTWAEIPNEQTFTITGLSGYSSTEDFKNRFSANNLFTIGQTKKNNMDALYLSCKVNGAFIVLVEALIHPALHSVKAQVKSQTADLVPLFNQVLETILK